MNDSTESQQPVPGKRCRHSRLLVFGLLGLWGVLLFVVVPALLRWYATSSACKAIERQIAAVRADGQPVSYADLAPAPVPDERNAAAVFRQAFDAILQADGRIDSILDAGEKEKALLLFEHTPILSVDAKKLRAILDAHGGALTLAEEALQRPSCRFGVDYGVGYRQLKKTPHRARLRRLRRLFGIKALLCHGEARHAEVKACLHAIVGLSVACASDGIYKGENSHFYDLASFLDLVVTLESAAPLPDATRQEVVSLLASQDCRQFLREALIAERVKWIDLFGMLTEEGVRSPGRLDSAAFEDRSVFAGRRMLRERMLRWLEATAAAVEKADGPPWESIPALDEAHNRLGDLVNIFIPPVRGCVSWGFHFSGGSIQSTWALRDAAVLGLSCEIFRSAKGAYPAKLDELAPELLEDTPPDPFTGKPFRYELRDGGRAFIVYSVGENLKDDGGVEDRPDKDDISWQGRAATDTESRGE
ncbi:MAG: hypothetical protein ACYTKD_16260 [Planctomycetota bacterium]|jgi:hypothetical protein